METRVGNPADTLRSATGQPAEGVTWRVMQLPERCV